MNLRTGLLFCSLLFGCGEVTLTQNPAPPAPDVGKEREPTAVILGSSFTDPIGTLNLIAVNPPRTVTSNIQTTHSDAVVRSFDNQLYVVNRLGADNIQVVDPSLNFAVTNQFSTGQGTNPQEIIVINPAKAYVTLYQPEDNRSEELAVDDLLVVNPSSGKILKTIDLTPFTGNDGERLARAASMVRVGNRIFVAVQDLPGDLSRPPNQPGKLVVIDTAIDAVVGLIFLAGRDPIAMTYSPQTGKIYLADADFFDPNSSYGGIEAVDPSAVVTEGIVIDDLLLGGTPGEIEMAGTGGFVVLSSLDPDQGSSVVRFDLTHPEESAIQTVYQGKAYIQDIAVDENGLLLVGDRDPEVNGILFIDPESGNVLDGPITVGMAPSSIAFIER